MSLIEMRRADAAVVGAKSTEAFVGRAAVLGALFGFLISVVGVTVAGTAAGLGAGASFGLGVFVGLWGGLGFGFMGGASVSLMRHGDDATSRTPH
jgi:hypothetical protein